MPESIDSDRTVTRFTIRPDQSELWARATSTIHPINYTAPVSGHVETGIDGDSFDVEAATVGSLQITLDELTSDEPHFDREMRERLDAQRYPTVVARLHQADPHGADLYHLSGELTLHGQTRSLVGDAHVVFEDAQLRASGRVVIDVRDFGVEPPKLLMLKVDPKIEIAVEIVADIEA